MKGKLLTVDEILKLDGKYVYIKPINKNYRNSEGKAVVKIFNSFIKFYPMDNSMTWDDFKDGTNLKSGKWLNVYEWIEESKTYKGWEILKMIDEGKLKDIDLIRKQSTGADYDVKGIKHKAYAANLFIGNTFTIKEKEYMTFYEAKKLGVPHHKDHVNNYIAMTIEDFIKEVDKKV